MTLFYFTLKFFLAAFGLILGGGIAIIALNLLSHWHDLRVEKRWDEKQKRYKVDTSIMPPHIPPPTLEDMEKLRHS